jgi:tetratricopeptide (TPR) repeat protein
VATSVNTSGSRAHSTRGASTAAYMLIATAAAATLFFLLWWMLQAEDAPWVPAGLAASVVLLVAASARLLVTRKTRVARSPHFVSSDRRPRTHSHSGSVMRSTSLHAAALRALQKQSADADEKDVPEIHRELYEMCTEYLAGAEKALQSPALQPDGRVALRAGQDKVRDLHKHHLLTWARGSARTLTHEAQKRVRLYEKIETANRALECIDSALKVFPNEEELNVSARAIREFIISSRVAHWVELAERAAFKGYHQRAIDCYKDALFYLTRDRASAAGEVAAERITREIDLLRAKMNTSAALNPSLASKSRPTRRRSN